MTETHRARAGARGFAISRMRPLLAATTALSALAAMAPARAQAPLATPTGGAVVAGSASIAQAPGATTITQGTARAAINWQSFNVGSRATVAFHQPSAQSVTLNRVLARDPSTIAGRINANGSIVLVNPNGVVFANGSEVNAAGLVVAAPGITNRNFMAGRMVFDQPANPNARIVNRGSITIAQAGLAALVAPQVANSGVIAAKLGSVVLAGARTATLDLYGDGLVSLDVQGAVKTVPVGPDGKPVQVLVTNSGTIAAEGGTVLLTAKAVDGLIQKLVDAGGTISANGAAGGAAGTVLVQGVGGSIRIAGTLMANGEGAGGTGGAVGLDATGRVAVADTARVSASGPAGGGLVAVGTTLARAKGGPGTAASLTAAQVLIAPGATISADATEAGNGGRVAVLSTVTTADHGAISAEGGPAGGNGGFVEVSGHDLAFDGTVNTAAPLGISGNIVLDPFNLQIVATGANDGDVKLSLPLNGVASGVGNTTPGATDTVSASVIEGLTGNVTLQAINNLEISANLVLPGVGQALVMQAGNDLTIDAGVVVSARGGITADAAFNFDIGATVLTNPGGITVNGTLTLGQTGNTISLSSGTGGISVGPAGLIDAGPAAAPEGFVFVTSGGALSESGNGAINATAMQAFAPSMTLNGPNSIAEVGDFNASAGGISLSDTFPSLIIFTMSAPNTETISVADDRILVPDSELTAGTIALGPFHDGVPITLEGNNPDPASGFAFDNADFEAFLAPTLKLVQPGTAPINITGSNSLTSDFTSITTLALVSAGAVSEDATGSLTVDVLTGSAGNVALNNVNNNILNVGEFSSTGSFSLADAPSVSGVPQDLTVVGTVTGQTGVSIDVTNSGLDIGSFVSAGLVSSPGNVNLVAAGDIFEFNGRVAAGTLTGSASSLQLNDSNAVGTLGAFSLPTNSFMFLHDDVDLTIAGPVSAVNSFVSLTTTGNLTLSGTLNATGDAVSLSVGGSITEPGGVILANVLSGTSGGAALFTGINAIGTLASISSSDPPVPPAFAAGGNFTFVNSTPLTITAPITVPNGDTITIVTDSLIQGSQSNFTGGSACRGPDTECGALEAPGGEVSIEPFTASVPVALVGAGPQPSGTLSLDDAWLAAITAGTLALSSFGTEPITIFGANQLGGLTDPNTGNPSGVNVLLVAAGGAFTEAAGASLNVGTLSGSAGSVALGGVNNIPTLDQFSSTGGFELTDAPFVDGSGAPLTVIGTVQDSTGVTLDVLTSSIGIGSATAAGLISSPGTVDLIAPIEILENSVFSNGSETFNGAITAGTLTGSTGEAFLQGSNAIGTLGAFSFNTSFGNEFVLNNDVGLTVVGPVDLPNALFVSLTSAGTLELAGPINAAGQFSEVMVSLTSAGDLILAGTVNATGGTVTVVSGGDITEPGGVILASTLSGTSGGAALLTGSNAIGTLASINNSVSRNPLDAFVAGGNFTLVDSSPLSVDAPVIVPAGDTIALVTNGLVEGSQTIFTETGNVTVFGALLAPGGEVAIAPFTANVPVALVGAGAQPAGTLSLDEGLLEVISAGTLALTSFAPEPITISGANQLSNLTNPNTGQASGVGALLANAGGALTEAAGGSLGVGVLTGSAGSVALGGNNRIATVDGFTSGSGFSLTDGEGLAVLGTLSAPSGLALDVAPGSLNIGSGGTPGTLTSAGIVDLQVPGGTIVAANGGVTAGTLTGTASGLAVFGFGSEIGALGSFNVSGAGSELSLTNGVPLTVVGPVSAGIFFIADPGAVAESGVGVINAGVLTGNAGSVALNGPNRVSILEEFASTGGFALTDTTGLTVLGSVTDPTRISLDVTAGNFAIGNVGTFGQLASAGPVNLVVPGGSIAVANGGVTAGTLNAAAAGLAQLGTADVATLGSFSVSGAAGEFSLTSTVPLTIAGPVSAAFLDIAAPGTLTLAGNIFTTGLKLAAQSGANPALPGSVLQVLSGGVFQELGTSVIAPLDGGRATLRIQLPAAGGTASFANLQAGATDLVLALGPGTATGTTVLGGLLVIGTGGSANLSGSVAGISGPAAASLARILPAVNTNYRFNGCVIQTTICAPLFVNVPQGSPNLIDTAGGPSLLPSVTLPPIVLLTIPAMVGESWTDAGGFPLPNIGRLDF